MHGFICGVNVFFCLDHFIVVSIFKEVRGMGQVWRWRVYTLVLGHCLACMQFSLNEGAV